MGEVHLTQAFKVAFEQEEESIEQSWVVDLQVQAGGLGHTLGLARIAGGTALMVGSCCIPHFWQIGGTPAKATGNTGCLRRV